MYVANSRGDSAMVFMNICLLVVSHNLKSFLFRICLCFRLELKEQMYKHLN